MSENRYSLYALDDLNNVNVLDASDMRNITEIGLPTTIGWMSFNPRTNNAYLASREGDRVFVIDGTSIP